MAEVDRNGTTARRPRLDFRGSLHRRREMVETVIVERIGGELGVVFPKGLLERMQIAEGDTFVVSTDEESLRLTPSGSIFERAMEAYRHGADKYRNALRDLAQSEAAIRPHSEIPFQSDDDRAADE